MLMYFPLKKYVRENILINNIYCDVNNMIGLIYANYLRRQYLNTTSPSEKGITNLLCIITNLC